MRGDVRMYRFAPPNKQRPVLVLTRPSALGFLNQVMVAPITSTIRDIPTEVVLDVSDGMKRRCAVNLDHVASVPKNRLGRWLTTVSLSRLAQVCEALAFAVGCDA
jgi:mRNA interferase MazF